MDGRVLPREPGDPRRLGPYELLGRLGQGGMGVVHLGRERRGGRLAAVKALRPELAGDPGFAARFRREVEAARRIDSPRVARVLGAEPAGPRPWLATEYVDGPTLAAAVAAGGPLTGERLAGFAAGVAEALAAIHAAGVVHRDLKPGNVLLERPGPDGPAGPGVKVIDFGIAWAADATMTRSGLRFGTPAWMAPERLRDQPAGPPADVFAWGALVAFAATARHPFGGGPPEAVAYRILHDPPDLSGVPATLRPLVEAALARDPSARPTAAGLARTLAVAFSPTRPLPGTDPTWVLAATGPTRVPPLPQGPTRVPPLAADPTRVLPAASGVPSAGPAPRRRRRRVGALLVALALLAGLVAAPQVVVAATGDDGADRPAPAVAKRCPDDRAEAEHEHEDEHEDDESTDDQEAQDGDESTDGDDREHEDRPGRADHRGAEGRAGPAPGGTDPGPAASPPPPTTHRDPAPPASAPPTTRPDPAPDPGGPVLGS
jgi:eukaryotic-like serine/threonine-protein kinase